MCLEYIHKRFENINQYFTPLKFFPHVLSVPDIIKNMSLLDVCMYVCIKKKNYSYDVFHICQRSGLIFIYKIHYINIFKGILFIAKSLIYKDIL